MERYRTSHDQSAMTFTMMLTGSFEIAEAAFLLQTISPLQQMPMKETFFILFRIDWLMVPKLHCPSVNPTPQFVPLTLYATSRVQSMHTPGDNMVGNWVIQALASSLFQLRCPVASSLPYFSVTGFC
jgi:hypothetical protein